MSVTDVPDSKTRRQQRKVGIVSLPWNSRIAPSFKRGVFLSHTLEQRKTLCRGLPASLIPWRTECRPSFCPVRMSPRWDWLADWGVWLESFHYGLWPFEVWFSCAQAGPCAISDSLRLPDACAEGTGLPHALSCTSPRAVPPLLEYFRWGWAANFRQVNSALSCDMSGSVHGCAETSPASPACAGGRPRATICF